MLDKLFKLIEKITPQKWRWVLSHEGFRRYFANTGWMFFGQMFSLLVSFFIGAWLARYLGPENYGVLNYVLAFVGLFGLLASLGIDGILNRELVKYPENRDKLLGTAYGLKIIGGSIVFLLSVVSSFLFSFNPLVKLLIVLFSFSFILQAINVISTYFQSEVKSKNNVKALLLATIISTVLKIVVILAGKGLIWIVFVYVLDALWQGIGFVIAYNKFGLKIRTWRFDVKLSKTMLSNSWPLMLAYAAGAVYLKVDQVIIGSILGDRDLGIYAAAVKLVEVWYFVPGIICISLFPAIVNAKKTNNQLYLDRLKNLYILMAAIPIVIAIPVTLFAKQIIYILFGSGYLEAVNILKIYIWSSLGIFLGIAANQYLITENLVKTVFVLNCVAMIVNIGLNLVFIPVYGLTGAAYVSLISYLVVPSIVLSMNRWRKNLQRVN